MFPLTKEVRVAYKTIAFDLLVGHLDKQKKLWKNLDQIIELKPTKVQTSLLAVSRIAKAHTRMVEEGLYQILWRGKNYWML